MDYADAARGLRHVFLRDAVFLTRIGIYPPEVETAQRLRVNLDLAVAEQLPVMDVADVLDYAALMRRLRARLADAHTPLLEQLAEELAAMLLEDARVVRVRVMLEKLDVFPEAASAGIAIERRQSAAA